MPVAQVLRRAAAAPAAPPLAASVQAHFGRAAKFANNKTRDWTVFFFFRILTEAEFEEDLRRIERVGRLLREGADERALGELRIAAGEVWTAPNTGREPFRDLSANQSVGGASLAEPLPAAGAFRAFLKAVVDHDFAPLKAIEEKWFATAGASLGRTGEDALSEPHFEARLEALAAPGYDRRRSNIADDAAGDLGRMWAQFGIAPEPGSHRHVWALLRSTLLESYFKTARSVERFDQFGEGKGAAEAGRRALGGGLAGVVLYELLRLLQPAKARAVNYRGPDRVAPAMVRSELVEQQTSPDRHALSWDSCPVNFVFTFAGLAALGVNSRTLASFPEPFQQGMAARADRLGDTGPSAPLAWDEPLGLNATTNQESVHGYFTGGFLVGDDDHPVEASLWDRLRADIAAFNAGSEGEGVHLRNLLNFWFRRWGLEIVRMEFGEDPYEVDRNGHVHRVRRGPYRVEHFGFADGVSQPFAFLGPQVPFDPPPGGGTPAPNRTWAPLAAGEIYLSEPDEDGAVQEAPLNALLRQGSTYVVFRKLEQQVPEFHAFLLDHRPDDPHAQLKLAAEFVGRWPYGASLVVSPDRPLGLGANPQRVINDFLYAADDPRGQRCPLGAHARRANPRDTGGTDEVRRHRILRRSISYGGPFLPPDADGDGRRRGLLFIALNARIDMQFELVQSRWIDGGEFLGQVGLDRCPIVGAHEGKAGDAFLEAGAAAPVTHLPRFVMTRGGDYFFAPGIDALRAIAEGFPFPPDGPPPYDGVSMGDAYTPSLFNPLLDADRLAGYADEILSGAADVIRVVQPDSLVAGDPAGSPVAFVGRYDDVVKVLSTVPDANPLVYSVLPYTAAGQRITRGHNIIEGTEPGLYSPTAAQHKLLHEILDAAWRRLNSGIVPIYSVIDRCLTETLDLAIRRVGTRGEVDLVADFALASVYSVVANVFGVPGPDWVTELAIALPFYRQHASQLAPGWLDKVKTPPPPIPGLATLQTWSVALAFEIFANYEGAAELMAVSDQAGGEFLEYLDELIATVRTTLLTQPVRVPPPPTTLVEAFIRNEARFVGPARPYPNAQAYYLDVATLLMGLTASAIGATLSAFGYAMDAVLDFGLDLPTLIPVLTQPPNYGRGNADDGIPRLIYETCRLNPPAQILMRACVQDDTLPSGGAVKAGDFVAAMVAAAGMDPRGPFTDPQAFSLFPFLQGPPRDITKYLLFGVVGGGRLCWGRDRLALLAVTECIKAAGRLHGLRRVPGEAGALRTNIGTKLGIALGLEARFDRVLPDCP
jgi:deferrochelatase/peroxidase EfeB/cytochrome P450